MEFYSILALVIGLIIGSLVMWVLARSRGATAIAITAKRAEDAEATVLELRQELSNRSSELQRLNQALTVEQLRGARLEGENKRIEGLQIEIDVKDDRIEELQSTLTQKTADCASAEKEAGRVPILEQMLSKAQVRINELGDEFSQLRERLKNEEELNSQFEEMREAFANQFASLSQEALKTSNESFLSLAEQNFQRLQESAKGDLEKRQQAISELLTPLSTKIRDFENKVDQVYRTEAAERNTLRGEIKNLVDLNKQISKEANNLTTALKGDTKKQGNWGELICEKILEYSGLRKGEEYKVQVSLQDESGRRLQPDIIVYLPDGKHVIIDSKVSLVAYDRYCAAESEEERTAAQIDHIASVKRHIKELSDKKYPALPALDSPDFTILFMPIESSFGIAVQSDSKLFDYAWDRKIVIVSPSTLLAVLRTISSLWKQERQIKNALDIADRAGKMYDKFVGFVDDLTSVGRQIQTAKSGYEDAMKKLHSGSGNLVRQSELLRELGAKATKVLPQTLIDRSMEDLNALPASGSPELRTTNGQVSQPLIIDSSAGSLFEVEP